MARPNSRSILLALFFIFLAVRYLRETGQNPYKTPVFNNSLLNRENEYRDQFNVQNNTKCLPVDEEKPEVEVEERCALCFFGLPRSYESMVLPGLVKNVFTPNADNKCDVFLHYFHKEEEPAQRKNAGGKLNPDEIFLVENAAKSVLGSNTTVVIVNDTDDSFLEQRKYQLERYQETRDKNGIKVYFPFKTKFRISSLDNMVKQWHSIDKTFTMMEDYMNKHNINYTRVAMLRNDVMFLTPFNIAMVDNTEKAPDSKHFVLPGFANFPVTDRMIYGVYDAVKMWSTTRFDRIEKRAWEYKHTGVAMHSEKFMAADLLPSIETAGYTRLRNNNVCFVRTRAASIALWQDCVRDVPKGLEGKNMTALIEEILERKCEKVEGDSAFCPPEFNSSVPF
ncbi:unnamed protein product [Cylindrotheca closterium]|uniref:Hexosyltransferase n=1 Tax=Cylindrotheca closterium TaxID=2856 RepID=A0AAD2JHP7_9STRA|nr:unnamed protein product [Cylindrotheca closterium]